MLLSDEAQIVITIFVIMVYLICILCIFKRIFRPSYRIPHNIPKNAYIPDRKVYSGSRIHPEYRAEYISNIVYCKYIASIFKAYLSKYTTKYCKYTSKYSKEYMYSAGLLEYGKNIP